MFYKGLNLGIDFTGGIIIEARTETEFNLSKLRDSLHERGYSGVTLQTFGSNRDIMVRVQPREDESQSKEAEVIKNIISEHLGESTDFRRVDYVGPKVGSDLIFRGILSLIFAALGIMAYVWIRFNLQFGFGAVVALTHDAFATIGFFIFSGYEFDLSSIAALLTILGFSINDTVVIYDRIRENLRKYKSETAEQIINRSVNETLSRSIMTVATAVLGCLALVVFGGDVIRGFSAAMMFGFLFGTYSSIYISAPVLLHTKFRKTNTSHQA